MSQNHYSFFAMLSRMKNIARWGLMRNSVTETLSEHTLDTAYIVHALIAIHNSNYPVSPLKPEHAVMYALYHDCSEILTGDMPTPVKYRNPALKAAYKAVEKEAGNELLEKLPLEMQPQFRQWFEIPAEYKPYIKAADKISALVKCVEERKMGNCEFECAYVSTLQSLKEMNLTEVEQFLADFLPAYSKTLDEL